MKTFSLALLVSVLGLMFAGCGHLDTTPPSSAERVLKGVVNHANEDLPPGSEVTVRVLDLTRGNGRAEVLGETTVTNATKMPVPFTIEFTAEDGQLMRTVNVEARVSVGGHLRYTTTTGHPITLGNVNDSHVIEVQLATKR
jgi:uncharacterized lipoprotein YbaY